MKTIEDFLEHYAGLWPEKTAIAMPKCSMTYRQLYDEVCYKAASIKGLKGKAIAFRNNQDINTLVYYFAIHMARAVAVPLEKDIPEEEQKGIESQLAGLTFTNDCADILYTSGTTGRKKGVLISHRAILANGENLIEAQGYNADLRFIVCGPLNHLGSLSKVYPTIMCGATLHILEGMKDTNAFFNAIEESTEKIGTFLVPASIRMLNTMGRKRMEALASKIDFIETGAAPISANDMTALCRILPKSRLYNTYASTETGIIATYNFNDGRCMEGCVGKALKNSAFAIANDGHIVCYGDTLMCGIITDGTISHKSHNTGVDTSDLGETGTEGMLHFKGRNDDTINTGGFKVAPTEIEDVVMGLEQVKECVCIADEHPIAGTVIRLLVVMEEGEKMNKKELARYIASKLESYKVPFYYEQVESIHRTYNGKIDRKAYRK